MVTTRTCWVWACNLLSNGDKEQRFLAVSRCDLRFVYVIVRLCISFLSVVTHCTSFSCNTQRAFMFRNYRFSIAALLHARMSVTVQRFCWLSIAGADVAYRQQSVCYGCAVVTCHFLGAFGAPHASEIERSRTISNSASTG